MQIYKAKSGRTLGDLLMEKEVTHLLQLVGAEARSKKIDQLMQHLVIKDHHKGVKVLNLLQKSYQLR